MSKKSIKVPGKIPPFHVPHEGPYGERCSVSRGNGLFFHFYLSEAPVEEPSHEMGGIHAVTVHGAPRRRKGYIYWGAAWFPKGIIYDTPITTLMPCILQHDTFHLG